MKYLLSFGGNPPVEADGGYDGETLTLRYSLDGSDFVLSASPRKLLHETVGDGLTLEFEEGKRTAGTLRSGAMTAPYPVYCTRLNINCTETRTEISVTFTDGDSERAISILIERCGVGG